MTTRLAVFGDVHGNAQATSATIAAIAAARPDAVVCLGDLVGYGANPDETIDLVRQLGAPTLMGNYDDGVGYDRDDCGCAYKDDGEREHGQASLMWTRAVVSDDRKGWLRTLAFDHRMTVGGRRLRFVHGSPRRINEYLFEDRDEGSLQRIARAADCDVLVFGHTHKPWTREIEGVLFVNAGSAGKPKDGDPRGCWAVLEVGDDGTVAVAHHRVPYDVAAAAAAIRAAEGLPDDFATDLETGGR